MRCVAWGGFRSSDMTTRCYHNRCTRHARKGKLEHCQCEEEQNEEAAHGWYGVADMGPCPVAVTALDFNRPSLAACRADS